MSILQSSINIIADVSHSSVQGQHEKSYLAKLVDGIRRYPAKRKRRSIARSALLAIAAQHPDWVDVGFDEHFLAHQGAPHMAEYFNSGQLPEAAALAEAWSNQYAWKSTTILEAQLRFMPVAQDFVDILSTGSI